MQLSGSTYSAGVTCGSEGTLANVISLRFFSDCVRLGAAGCVLLWSIG
jgi:hypothetical protein